MNILSVDVEEWYHFNCDQHFLAEAKQKCARETVVTNTNRLLTIFRECGVEATFFILGEIAEAFPDLVRRIDEAGHEIASHGYSHQNLSCLSREELSRDIHRSIDVLSKCAKQRIMGYRAPYLSGDANDALDEVLLDCGIIYDSSRKMGLQKKFRGKAQGLLKKFLVSSVRVMGRDVAYGGGTYFRMLPTSLIESLVHGANDSGRGVHFYLHPRDIDTALPQVKMSPLSKIRYVGRIGNTELKLRYLLGRFRFHSVREVIKNNLMGW